MMVDKLWRVQIDVFDYNLDSLMPMWWYSEKRTEEEAKIEALEEFITATWNIVEVHKPVRISLESHRGQDANLYIHHWAMVERLLKGYIVMYEQTTPNRKLLTLINNRMTEMYLRK